MHQITSSREENFSGDFMKYFLFNHSGSLNHGCEAIIRGTINIIRNADENSNFVVSSYDSASDIILEGTEIKQFKTRALSRVETVAAALDLKLRKSEEYALRKMYSPIVEQAADCDICLSVGGDTYCYGDNHGIQILTEELKKSGKKVVLWGASIGKEDLTEDKLKNLSVFDAIFARESLTYDLLKEKNANENIFLHSDPAFCMERDDMDLPDGFTKENAIGINVSPLVQKHNPDIQNAVRDFIEYIIENTTLKVLLVPHVVENGNNDYEFMLPYYEEFKKSNRVAILPDSLNAKQYKGYIAKLRFFIGARTHATIAAYSSGVPTYVIGYSVKSCGIATDLFGKDDYVIDVRKIRNSHELINALNTLLNDEAEIKKTLMKKIPMQLRSSMQMGSRLLDL